MSPFIQVDFPLTRSRQTVRPMIVTRETVIKLDTIINATKHVLMSSVVGKKGPSTATHTAKWIIFYKSHIKIVNKK